MWPDKPFMFETLASKYSAPEIFKFGGSESVGLFGEAIFTGHVVGPFVYGILLVIFVKLCINFYSILFKSDLITWGGVVLLPYSFFTSGLLFSSMTIQMIYTLIIAGTLKYLLVLRYSRALKA
jgi:hypothetical protein